MFTSNHALILDFRSLLTSDGPLSMDISFMFTPEDVGHESHEDHLDFGVVKREKW